jgi:hypothetical protein
MAKMVKFYFTEFHLFGKKLREKLCKHEFELDKHNGAKRTCTKCRRHEWMYGHGSSLHWEVMPFGERE